jgi:outer membrane protein insertion porin family
MRLVLAALLAWHYASAQAPARKKSAPRAPAEKPQSSAVRFPILAFEVKGNRIYTRDQVIASSGLRTGQEVSPQAFEAARDRLVATGAFLQVEVGYQPSPNKQGYLARIQVVEVEQVYPLQFEDLPLSGEKLRDAIVKAQPLFADKVPGSKEALAIVEAAVAKAVLEAQPGFAEPITAAVMPGDPGQLVLLVRSGRARPNIAQVTFSGSKVIDIADLQNAFSQLAIGTPYTEAAVRKLLDSGIRPMFEKRGHLEVRFPRVEAMPSKRVTGVDVTITVEDGPVYRFGETRVEGVPQAESLARLADLKSGEVANFDQVKEAEERLKLYFRRQGYIRVACSWERTLNTKDKTVDVEFRLEPGEPYTFGSLRIQGLDILTEPAIRKMWGLKSGESFNQEYPDLFLQRIKEQGILDNLREARSEIRVDERNRIVDVTLIFR